MRPMRYTITRGTYHGWVHSFEYWAVQNMDAPDEPEIRFSTPVAAEIYVIRLGGDIVEGPEAS